MSNYETVVITCGLSGYKVKKDIANRLRKKRERELRLKFHSWIKSQN